MTSPYIKTDTKFGSTLGTHNLVNSTKFKLSMIQNYTKEPGSRLLVLTWNLDFKHFSNTIT